MAHRGAHDVDTSPTLAALMNLYGEARDFAMGDQIFPEGAPSDSFFLIEAGDVRLEIRSLEVDTDSVLRFSGAGELLGEVGVLGRRPRSASAYAHTDVRLRRVSTETLVRLRAEEPAAAVEMIEALGRGVVEKLLHSTERVAAQLHAEAPDPVVERMVRAAAAAQEIFAAWPEEQVDSLLTDLARTVDAHADELAAAAVAETTIGNVADKALKIRFASVGVWASLTGTLGTGRLGGDLDQDRKVDCFASPMGVVFALAPLTEPVGTVVNKALITLKARNSLIVSSHRGARGVAERTVELLRGVLAVHGAPQDLVQDVRSRASRQTTMRFMRHPGVAIILATGGSAMVRAAYSCGKPAIGVGEGNAPVFVSANADVDLAAQCLVESKSFDNGLVCGAEQHIVVDAQVKERLIDALARHRAVVLDESETKQLVAGAFDQVTGDLQLQFVGRPAGTIATATGLDKHRDARLLVFPSDASVLTGANSHERLAPVLSMFTVESEDEAIELCHRLLLNQGAGHTAVIHASDEGLVERYAGAMPVSRVLANVPASLGCCGVVTGLHPSLTLGCGTFGGTSTTDNVSTHNLVNIKRLARPYYGNLIKMKRLARGPGTGA